MEQNQVGLSVPFLCALLLLLLFDPTGQTEQILLAAALHEGGHLLVMARMGHLPQRMVFGGFGVRIEQRAAMDVGYGKEALIYAAGPAVNLLCALLLQRRPDLQRIHLTMGLFNLLPLGCLDGGQLLRCILRQKVDFVRGTQLQKVLSAFLSAAVLLFGIVYAKQSPSLLVTGLYLLWNLLWGAGEF